jgi:hypothetical protein
MLTDVTDQPSYSAGQLPSGASSRVTPRPSRAPVVTDQRSRARAAAPKLSREQVETVQPNHTTVNPNHATVPPGHTRVRPDDATVPSGHARVETDQTGGGRVTGQVDDQGCNIRRSCRTNPVVRGT